MKKGVGMELAEKGMKQGIKKCDLMFSKIYKTCEGREKVFSVG